MVLTSECHEFVDSNVDGFSAPQPQVAILLCTYNGEEFIRQQLDSFVNQTYPNWSLYVSDDGSTDSTLKILQEFARKVGEDRVIIFNGPKDGFASNFLSLIHHDEICADYFAFADQDDVWLPRKLETSLNWHNSLGPSIPALYCSRTTLIDAQGRVFGKSDLFLRSPSFSNALVQSIGGGNTMVLNAAARNLVSAHSPVRGIISHDWWVYIVVSGNDGWVKYDPDSQVLYRQHGGNLVGMNGTWLARLRRAVQLFRGRFKYWNNINLEIISEKPGFMSQVNMKIFLDFKKFRNAGLIERVIGLSRSGLYRQTWLGDIGLCVGNFFNKI